MGSRFQDHIKTLLGWLLLVLKIKEREKNRIRRDEK